MRGQDNGSSLDELVQFRASESTTDFLDQLKDDWGLQSRSAALRIIIHSWAGLLNGNVWAVLDESRLREEWGDLGHILANAHEHDEPISPTLAQARLIDVIEEPPVLLGAAKEEVGLVPPEADVDGDSRDLPDVGGER